MLSGDFMRLFRCALIAAACQFAAAGLSTGAAWAQVPEFHLPSLPNFGSEPRYNRAMPHCDDFLSLQEIRGRFETAEAFTFHSPLRMAAISDIREVAVRPDDQEDYIPRRFCSAKVAFNDRSQRVLKYEIIERGGFMGVNRGVEWCVVGMDRYRAFAPDCDAAGPIE